MSNSDGSGGANFGWSWPSTTLSASCRLGKGLSVTTRECYVRHVLPFLTEVGGTWSVCSTSAACQLSACVRM